MRLWMILLAALAAAPGARAEALVHFPSAADRGPNAAPTELDGYLYRAPGNGRHPAIVFMHGCGGLLSKAGKPWKRERAWAGTFNARGWSVLMVDSLAPRGSGETCSQAGFKREIYRARPDDAYGALRYLQDQPFVRPDRIALMGWSQGGGATLIAIRDGSRARPPALPKGDFRAAVAFYPASCRTAAYPDRWTTSIPTQVLVGENDVWTPAAPCREMIEAAGTPAAIKTYPGAYHDFDWPEVPVHPLPKYETSAGVVPIAGENPAAHADATALVPSFLARYLDD